MACGDDLPLRQDPASDERPGLRLTLGRTSCLRIFKSSFSIKIQILEQVFPAIAAAGRQTSGNN